MPLRVGERRLEFGHLMKENLQVEEEKRKKAEEQLETEGVELEGARAELMATQAEVAQLKEAFSKYQEDALIEVSRLQARAEDVERKVAKVPGEIAAAKTAILSEYQSSAKFEQVRADNFDEGVCTFIYNIWCEHLKWDLSFLGEVAREMIVEFNTPPETPIADLLTDFVPPADHSPEVADRPLLVINEDSPAVTAGGGGGGADEGDEVMQIDNPTCVLSYEGHSPSRRN